MEFGSIQVKPLSPNVGARVNGIDLSQPLGRSRLLTLRTLSRITACFNLEISRWTRKSWSDSAGNSVASPSHWHQTRSGFS